MSVVTGIILSMSVCEEHVEDETPPAVVALNAWLQDNGFTPLRPVEEHFGGNKHPQLRVFGCGYNHFPEDEFIAQVATTDWEYPANVILIVNPETGPARVWQGEGDYA